MTWLKSSDTAGMNPRVLAPLAWQRGPDDDLDGWDLRLPAIAGLAWLCATYSASQETDYVVADATVALYGGPQWQHLAQWVERAGIWTRVDGGWLLADDSEHLFHIRLKAEVAWERQRKNDNGNTALTVPVRIRDGDGCRYCGRVVNWGATRGGLAGTYDHRRPGHAAQGPDDLVVACNQCNGRRGKDPHPERWTPLPAPAQPYYGEITVEHLTKHGFEVPLSTGPRPAGLPGGPRIEDARPDTQPDPAPAPPQRRSGSQPDPAAGAPAASRSAPSHRRAAASRPEPTSATPPSGHRARTTSATPPSGHRARRDAATSAAPPTVRARPGSQPDPAAGAPAASRSAPSHRRAAASRPEPTSATPPSGHRAPRDAARSTAPRADPAQDQQGSAGTGRKPAGTAGAKPSGSGSPGRVGTGRDGSGAPPRPTPTNRKRGRRAPRAKPPHTPPRPEDHES
ncbi:hypothetical protein [Micromonospora aurantiaca (nom. illeg.)]|uniref:hypothetical protein n=1 Tax=Micromonospora aurantiaca (nom. illeg.) TaxID=47850 RepID=UPI003404222B